MSTGKKTAVGVGGVVALLILVGAAYFVVASPVDKWIAKQLRATVNGYLVPQCEFDSLDYQAPRTVVVKGFRMTADDPDSPGQTIDIVTADRVVLTLTELPKEGSPLQIERLELDGAVFRLVESAHGSGLIGFSNFVQKKPAEDAPPIGEVLQITRIDLKNGEVVHDSRSSESVAMRYSGITTSIDITEQSTSEYNVGIELKQGPRFDLQISSVCDVNQWTFDFKDFALNMSVGRDQDQYLPPQIQQVLRDHQIEGELKLTGSGLLRAADWKQSTLRAKLEFKNGYAVASGYQLPLDLLMVDAAMSTGQVDVRRIEAELFAGKLRGDAVIKLDEVFSTDVRLGGDKLYLQETLVAAIDGERPEYAGELSFDASVQLPLAGQTQGPNLHGRGTAKLRKGRVVSVPVISDVVSFMAERGHAKRDRGATGSDRGDMTFALRGDHAYIDKAEVVGTWFAMRGRGQVGFDGQLKMNVNAGPMQKVQSTLGPIGDVFGALTDGLVAYRVSGDFTEPKVSVAAFSGIVGAPGERDRESNDPKQGDGPSPLDFLTPFQ